MFEKVATVACLTAFLARLPISLSYIKLNPLTRGTVCRVLRFGAYGALVEAFHGTVSREGHWKGTQRYAPWKGVGVS